MSLTTRQIENAGAPLESPNGAVFGGVNVTDNPPDRKRRRCEDIEYKLVDGIRRPGRFTLKAKVAE